jgi:hypothetical protein
LIENNAQKRKEKEKNKTSSQIPYRTSSAKLAKRREPTLMHMNKQAVEYIYFLC